MARYRTWKPRPFSVEHCERAIRAAEREIARLEAEGRDATYQRSYLARWHVELARATERGTVVPA